MQIYLTFSPYWQKSTQPANKLKPNQPPNSLPLDIVAGPIMIGGGLIASIGRPKLLIVSGLTLDSLSTILLPFSARLHDRYWPLVFPASVVGSAGTAVVFVLANISIFQTTPPEYARTVGAVFNSAPRPGGAIGSSATTSTQASIDERVQREGTFDGTHFQGRAAALWFLLAWAGVVTIGVAVFYGVAKAPAKDVEGKEVDELPKVVVH